MDIPKTTEMRLSIVRKLDPIIADQCLKHIEQRYNSNIENFWGNVSIWLKFVKAAIDLIEYAKSNHDLDVTYDWSDFDKHPNCSIAKQALISYTSKFFIKDMDIIFLKYKQLIYKDEFGDNNIEEFTNYFFNKYYPRYESNIYSFKEELKVFCDKEWVDSILISETCGHVVHNLFDMLNDKLTDDDSVGIDLEKDAITPYEYEKLIASQFNQLGWDAYATSGSGDQGADVIVEKDGLLFVVQCKMYSQPVGNKAVQEVSSAKDYYDAAGAVVVTNNDYTKSARQLADSQNVWLIHDSQIASWCLMIEEALED